MTNSQIIALGGGGFSDETVPFLDDYIIQTAKKSKPKICFIPTASGDSETYLNKFYRRFTKTKCLTSDLSLFKREIIDLEDYVCNQDIIYVGGGNTANMLAIWKTHGLDKALKVAYKSGVILTGISAGSICWFEQGVTDSFGTELQAINCLGFIKGSNCPHYSVEKARRPAYHQLMKKGKLSNGYAADDCAALHFINGKLHKVVSSQPNSKAYQVKLEAKRIIETELKTSYLGDVTK